MALAGMLTNLPPSTRRIVVIGGAALGGYLVLRSRNRPDPVEDDTPATPAPDGFSGLPTSFATDVIGVDQLMEFESGISTGLADLYELISEWDQPHNPTPTPVSPANPKAPSTSDPQLGKRTTQSRNVQPPGRGWPGETMSEISLRVYGSRSYWNYIRFFNNDLYRKIGSPDKAIPAGTEIFF